MDLDRETGERIEQPISVEAESSALLDRALELGANAAILKTGDFDILIDALAVL